MKILFSFFHSTSRHWHVILYSYALVAGFFLIGSFSLKIIPYFEFVGVVPLLFLLVLPMRNNRELFLCGWLAGMAAFGTYISWFFDVLPLDWIGISQLWVGYVLVSIAWFLASGYFSLWFGIFLVLVKKYSFFIPRIPFILFLWPLLEYLRTFIYPLHPYIWGPGNIWGDNTGFLLLGYTLADHASLRPIAHVLGIYGISIIVLIPNLIIFDAFTYFCARRKDSLKKIIVKRSPMWASLVLLFIIFYIWGAVAKSKASAQNQMLHIALVQSNVFPEDWSGPARQRYSEGVERTSRKLFTQVLNTIPPVDLIVFPEEGVSIFDVTNGTVIPPQEEIREKMGVLPYRVLIDPLFMKRPISQNTHTIFLMDNKTGILGMGEKQFLMPWGEYLPYATRLIFSLFRFNQLPDNWHWYVPGSKSTTFTTSLGRIAVLSCSELLSPYIMRKTYREKPDMVVFPSSLGILHGSERVQKQNLAMAQIQAAAMQIPIVVNVNAGRSFVLDWLGNIVWQNPMSGNVISLISVTIKP